jgi:hypothetical protein
MRSSKRIIVKLFLLLILAVSLVIGGYSWADAHSYSVSAKALASAPSPTEILERIVTPQLVRRQRTRRKPVKSKQAEINYESIAQDIRLMLSWVESPEVTPAWLASKLRNDNCIDVCTIQIRNDHNNPIVTADNHSFRALKNEKVIYQVDMASKEGSSSLKSVNIDLGFDNEPFSVTQLAKLLSSKNVQPRLVYGKFPSCDAGPCYFGRAEYLVDVDTQNSSSSSNKQYRVYLGVGVNSVKKLAYLRRISFESR